MNLTKNTRISGDKGSIYDVSFEQLFADYDSCMAISYAVA